MRDLDINLMLTFRAFVDAGSVAAAAKRLGRSQPAISARLHQLERDLGAPLLERVGRRLQLTALGRKVDDETRKLAARAQRIVDLARSAAAIPAGRLRVGALPTVGVHLLAPILRDLLAEDGLDIDIVYDLNAGLVAKLKRGELDAVVTVGDPPTLADLDVAIWGAVRPVLVASSRRKMPREVNADFIRKRALLAFGRIGDPFFDEIDRFVERRGLVPRLVVSHIHTLKALAAHGAGVAILPDYTVSGDRQLRTASIAGLELEHPLWLAARSSARELAALTELRRLIAGSTLLENAHRA